MSKLKVFLYFAASSGLVAVFNSLQELDKYSFAVGFWTATFAGVVAALISSKQTARILFFVLIGLNILAISHIAYISVTNTEAPIFGLAVVALIFNINVWFAAIAASAAPNWVSRNKYSNTENRSNWTKIDQGEDPTL